MTKEEAEKTHDPVHVTKEDAASFLSLVRRTRNTLPQPSAETVAGYPGMDENLDEFAWCYEYYGGKSWEEALDSPASPNYASLNLMDNPITRSYYLGTEMYRMVRDYLDGDYYWLWDRWDHITHSIRRLSGEAEKRPVLWDPQKLVLTQWWLLWEPEEPLPNLGSGFPEPWLMSGGEPPVKVLRPGE